MEREIQENYGRPRQERPVHYYDCKVNRMGDHLQILITTDTKIAEKFVDELTELLKRYGGYVNEKK